MTRRVGTTLLDASPVYSTGRDTAELSSLFLDDRDRLRESLNVELQPLLDAAIEAVQGGHMASADYFLTQRHNRWIDAGFGDEICITGEQLKAAMSPKTGRKTRGAK